MKTRIVLFRVPMKIKRQVIFERDLTRARAVDDLIEMVISQAQKIAEQAKEIERLETTYDLIPLDAEHQRLRS